VTRRFHSLCRCIQHFTRRLIKSGENIESIKPPLSKSRGGSGSGLRPTFSFFSTAQVQLKPNLFSEFITPKNRSLKYEARANPVPKKSGPTHLVASKKRSRYIKVYIYIFQLTSNLILRRKELLCSTSAIEPLECSQRYIFIVEISELVIRCLSPKKFYILDLCTRLFFKATTL
jgi:hypothetical protein